MPGSFSLAQAGPHRPIWRPHPFNSASYQCDAEQLVSLSLSPPRIWPRISPAGKLLVWTLAYAVSVVSASSSASKSPGVTPCDVGPTTLAAVIVPCTVPLVPVGQPACP